VKQVAQRPGDGKIAVIDVPPPALRPGWVLVRNRCSLISAGTERRKLELGEKGLMGKARARPDLVRKTVDRARSEGVRSTIAIARDRLAALAPMGYSSAGEVVRVGAGVEGLAPGDRVACAGGGWAGHAELVSVPRNLVAKVPDGVPLDQAAYATLGAIALHAVRRADVAVGERAGVIGLGLVGQLAVRIARAAGCDVFGIDLDETAVDLCRRGGARAFRRDRPALEQSIAGASGGLGLDVVLVCAASRSNDPLELAARLARDRGRLVVVGDLPIEADRALLYAKELELRLSRSYGPGRYDRDYEEHGRDLPPAYVRWTEQRNLEAFLRLVAEDRLDPAELTTHRFPLDRAEEAYAALTAAPGPERAFGVLLEYPHAETPAAPIQAMQVRRARAGAVGLVGAGSFARATLIPALRSLDARLAAVASERGLSAADVASRFGFERVAGSPEEIFADDSIGAVVIATRHSSHAALAAAALRAGKAVFVEKPLALDWDGLHEVEAALAEGGLLMVGFNRRLAPLIERLRTELEGAPDRLLAIRVNAGPLARGHWLHDPDEGGGRLLGEGCHFVDLLASLAGSPPVSAHALAVPEPERPLECSNSFTGLLRFADGAVGSLVYAGGGDSRLPKERIEAFGGGLSAVLDDFRRLELYRGGRKTVMKSRQDKGHRATLSRFLEAASSAAEAPPAESYLASSRATLALADSLRTGLPVELSP
jgi:predicted dehydrogenase/threonine dehydrogenase-like Zn-dependent dehydrogenase